MERIAEPELMDDAAQARAYAGADFCEAHQAFVGYFQARFPHFAAGRVIDLGCGPADVALRFARAYPGVEVVGVDGAAPMLEWGRRAIAAAGLAGRVRLEKIRLPSAALTAAFDAVISNSLLHHLADPAVLWRTIRQASRPGAPVLVMDLMRPADAAGAKALTARYAGGAPGVLQRDFFHSLRAAYRPDEVRAQLDAAGLSDFSAAAVSDRHWLAWGVR
ncbi:MAG TPA: SAM-dependent methyltransferase [Betaproteobacteria bacterium]|nr:SAM-dependent methyltransferase [Betaproteobacteria bacterium]